MNENLSQYIADTIPFAKLAWGGVDFNTTLGVLLWRQYLQLLKEFKEAKGIFSRGQYTSNFVIADRTSIEPIVDEKIGKQRITNGKPDFLLKLSTTKDNVPTSNIFRGDFQREAMRFINRARKRAKSGEGTRPIFELMRENGVITKYDEIRLKTSKERIIASLEASWTRYCSERAKRTNDFNFVAQNEKAERIPSISVLAAEPDGKNNQIRIFDLPKWQLDSNNIPTTQNANIWVYNSLVDLFPEDPSFQHVPPAQFNHQRYRLKSLRSLGDSLMSDPQTLLAPCVVSEETGIFSIVELAVA